MSLILSKPSLEYKECLVYLGLTLYQGPNGLQNIPNIPSSWPQLEFVMRTTERIFVSDKKTARLVAFLVQPPKPAGRMSGGSRRKLQSNRKFLNSLEMRRGTVCPRWPSG